MTGMITCYPSRWDWVTDCRDAHLTSLSHDHARPQINIYQYSMNLCKMMEVRYSDYDKKSNLRKRAYTGLCTDSIKIL